MERDGPVVNTFNCLPYCVRGWSLHFANLLAPSQNQKITWHLLVGQKILLIRDSEDFNAVFRLQCFDSLYDFCGSDGIFLPQMYLACVWYCDSDWI